MVYTFWLLKNSNFFPYTRKSVVENFLLGGITEEVSGNKKILLLQKRSKTSKPDLTMVKKQWISYALLWKRTLIKSNLWILIRFLYQKTSFFPLSGSACIGPVIKNFSTIFLPCVEKIWQMFAFLINLKVQITSRCTMLSYYFYDF